MGNKRAGPSVDDRTYCLSHQFPLASRSNAASPATPAAFAASTTKSCAGSASNSARLRSLRFRPLLHSLLHQRPSSLTRTLPAVNCALA
eukprot:6727978-Lingulodinium_polyedra.AAC.1